MDKHLENLLGRRPVLESINQDLEDAYHIMEKAFKCGRRMYLCGNGGSAADCEHWAGELLKGFAHKRTSKYEDLPKIMGMPLQGALPVIPLTGFLGLTTAFANDVSAEFTFAQLVYALVREGDVLVGISTSGNAKNVIHAINVAKVRGVKTIGLTGASGGELAKRAHCVVKVPESETYLIQELHLPIYHYFCLRLEESFFPQEDSNKV